MYSGRMLGIDVGFVAENGINNKCNEIEPNHYIIYNLLK